ncbi:MAG TPA: WD40 repeat domain-containing protein [Acetobacteraceae bacterium]|nr:WD40 repeat domain-containing protein [Acetobacteraceae bacterium]
MSGTVQAPLSPDFLLQSRGVSHPLGAYVVGAAFSRDGGLAAFALGDGTLRLARPDQPEAAWETVAAHAGAVLALAPDALPGGFVTGGDDGAFRRITPEGTTDIARFGAMKWVEQVASFGDGKAGWLACSVGRAVHLFDAAGQEGRRFDHPSTVTGLDFDGRGKRLAASHYNGASLRFTAAREDKPRVLEWKGSHIGVILHPAAEAVVTAMQENALHGWKLPDGQHMRMSGYPAKTESLSFSRNGKWLASSGADVIVLWPFFGGGPMGKPPLELGGGTGALCTRVACHPGMDSVAAGFDDGSVILADIDSARILPVAAGGRGKVTALAWSPDGARLAFGTESGFAALVDFSRR